jgi:hypothetical protein
MSICHGSTSIHSYSHNSHTLTIPDDRFSPSSVPLLALTTSLPPAARVPQIAAAPLLRLPPTIHAPDPPLPTQQPQIDGMGVHPPRTLQGTTKSR